ncbi:MAG: ABC transporter ATP-binding protein [Hyphomicrobiaceae bacterium]
MSPANLLEVEDIRFRWIESAAFELVVPHLALAAGEKLLLMGPSGAGKSTLLSLVAGIVAPQSGAVRVLGENIARFGASRRDRFRAEHIGVVFQMFNLLPYGSAIDNVLLPLSFAPGRRARVGSTTAQIEEAGRLLARLGLSADAIGRRRAADLSVGQQQRVAAARALIGRPELLIADEPTSALDPAARDQFLDLVLGEIAGGGTGLLMVSHDPGLARRFDRVVQLADVIRDAGQPVAAGAGA